MFIFQILVASIVMDSGSECDRRSVSKANTTRMFEARARKGRRFQGLTQAAAASRAKALEENVSDEVDADSDEPSHKIILPLSYKFLLHPLLSAEPNLNPATNSA